jgi:recombinational DNA repair ATPase RecF
MFLKSVHLINFKSFKDCNIDFHKGFNALLGVNGIGKSNVIGTTIIIPNMTLRPNRKNYSARRNFVRSDSACHLSTSEIC